MKPLTKKAAIIVTSAIAVFFIIVLYKNVNPATAPFPRCPFNLLTGLKCPGCGTQRAIHLLLNLKIGDAFKQNAVFVVFVPIVLFLILAELLKTRLPKLYTFSSSSYLSYGLLVVIILWWLLRNIFNW